MARTLLLLVAAILVVPGLVTAQDPTIVSAASYVNSVAPDSWASAFGGPFSSNPLGDIAALDPATGRFPTRLAGVSVTVDGVDAEIYFVTPAQINFLIPFSVTPGRIVSVVITARQAGATYSKGVQMLSASPGLFSRASSGEGPGSILNAVTFQPGPFLVETEENGGADKRTRIAIYGTGFRFAGTGEVDAVVRVPIGEFALPLEYYGPAPGFFGLDQANLVLPPEADGFDEVLVSLRTPNFRSNEVSFSVGKLDDSKVRLVSIATDKSAVLGGEKLFGRVRLNARAGNSGKVVLVSSNKDLIATVFPSQVTVAPGDVEAEFQITTRPPTSSISETATLTARTVSEQVETALRVEGTTNEIASLFLDPQRLVGGRAALGRVQLRQPAPSVGVRIELSSGNTAVVAVPPFVDILGGRTEVEFNLGTVAVSAETQVQITASAGASTVSSTLYVNPAVALFLNPASVFGGQQTQLEVRLGAQAPVGGATVELRTANPRVSIPNSVLVPSGQISMVLVLGTLDVLADQTAEINAFYANTQAQVVLTIKASTSVTLASLALNPSTVVAGQNVAARVDLTGPAPLGGAFVTLSKMPFASSAIFDMPNQVIVPSGTSAANFNIRTTSVLFSAETVTVVAKYGTTEKTAPLTVNPK